MARAKTGRGSVMSELQATRILTKANFRAKEPFRTKMQPWLMECQICRNTFKRRLRDVVDGFGCKYCNHRAWTADSAIEKMKLSGFTPLEPYKNSATKWLVRCHGCEQEIRTSLHGIVSGSSKGCAICALENRRQYSKKEIEIFKKIRDLEYTILPGQSYKGSKRPIKVECKICGTASNFLPSYLRARSTIVRGCKTCSNNKLKLDDAVLHRRFRDANLRPLEKITSGKKSVSYQCILCGYQGKCSATSLKNARGCFKCGKKRGADKRKLGLAEVKKMFSDHDLELIGKYENSVKPIAARCLKCDRVIKKSFNQIKRHKNGCPFCSLDKVDPLEAVDQIRRRGFEPLEPFPGGKTPWKCKCRTCGRVSKPTSVSKNQLGTRCGFCSKNRVDPAEAVDFMLANGIEPLEPYQFSNKPWRCRCMKCSREIKTRYNSVKNGIGCRFCAVGGMDFNAPAFVYLIVHERFNALKVGIGSQQIRLRQHTILDWEVVKVWRFATGHKASAVEEKVLTHLRKELGLSHYLSKDEMPQKGHTETFCLDDIDIPYVQKLITKCSRKNLKWT